MTIKIAFCGTHGTGKTTLVLNLAAAIKSLYPHKRVGIVTEQARSCPLPINQEATLESQLWIYHSQFTAEIEASFRNDIVVCDRTVLDSLAYGTYHNMVPSVKSCEEQIKLWWTSYDKVVFCRPDMTPPVNDGIRSDDRDFQIGVHREFERLCQSWSLPFTELGKDTQPLLDLIGESIKTDYRHPNLRLMSRVI